MTTPLIEITVTSVYKNKDGERLPLPKRMALCTPDMEAAIHGVNAKLALRGGRLFLSDLFRSFDMQLQSHMDFINGKKTAFSPPPGGSLHEAGRALDLDLGGLGMELKDFWEIARSQGLFPIIASPDPKVSEAWHFDCRGSHHIVYEYYNSGKGTNFKPYAAMAASAILSIGVMVEKFGANQKAAAIQSALIRLGQNIGNMDGVLGNKTRAGLDAVSLPVGNPETVLAALEGLLQLKFPQEFEVAETGATAAVPAHVIQ